MGEAWGYSMRQRMGGVDAEGAVHRRLVTRPPLPITPHATPRRPTVGSGLSRTGCGLGVSRIGCLGYRVNAHSAVTTVRCQLATQPIRSAFPSRIWRRDVGRSMPLAGHRDGSGIGGSLASAEGCGLSRIRRCRLSPPADLAHWPVMAQPRRSSAPAQA